MTDDIAIRVNGLGKKYRISHQAAAYKTLGETITNALKSPFRRFAGAVPNRSTEEFWALKDISFEVERGEILGIIGRNGAGKSTLLKVLSRITTPTEGTIEVHGRIGSLLEVGTGFHPELSGRENIYLSGSILGMRRSEINEKFDEIVKFAEMERFLDTPVKRYSSGMYVRLAFAVAAHLDPEILIIDEVLAVGDYEFQQKCLGKMGAVAREGRTVLFVSHNMKTVRDLCETGILLERGQIRIQGRVNEIVDRYISACEEEAEPISLYPDRPDLVTSIERVEVSGLNGPSLVHDVCEPISVEVGFTVRKPLEALDLWLAVFTLDGTIVFQTCSRDVNIQETVVPAGYHTSRLTLPAPFLNEGRYELVLALQRGHLPYDLQRGIYISLEDRTRLGSAALGMRREGCVLVSIPWEIK